MALNHKVMNATLPEVIARVSVSMSNLSIIQRLEQRLSAYSAGELARADFVDFLSCIVFRSRRAASM